MNSREWFDMMLTKGEYGEKYIIPQLSWACKCWRYHITHAITNKGTWITNERCRHLPTPVDVTKDEWLWKTADVDAKLVYDCAGCPVYDWNNAGRAAGQRDKRSIEEWHEIKTNYAAHKEDYSADNGAVYGTQNIYIELIGNKQLYDEGEYWEYRRGTEKRKIRKGIGWWLKNGDTKDDWYHFFQPMDDGFCTPEFADEKLVRRWLNDTSVPDGAVLILKWPFSYCLSITGEYLKKIIALGNYGKPLLWVNNNGKMVRQQAHLIPIGDVLPCVAFNPNPQSEKGKQMLKEDGIIGLTQGGDVSKLGRFYDAFNVVAFIGGDSIVVKGDEKQEGNLDWLYVPQALYDTAMGADKFDVAKLNGKENASGAKLVVNVGMAEPDWHFYKEKYQYGGSIVMPKLEYDEVARAEVYR